MKPIERFSITDSVVTKLKELITSGQLKVGDKLPTEKEVCRQLNVGRSSVREAYRMLQAMGFITIEVGRGAFVAKVTEDDTKSVVKWFIEHEIHISDFMEVRMAIDPLAVGLAIKRASNYEISLIEEIIDKFETAVFENDHTKLVTADELFHSEIIKLSNNKLLISINENISNELREYRTKSFAVKENAIHALEPHRKILEAIKNRDLKVGEGEMLEHIMISLNDISNVIKKSE